MADITELFSAPLTFNWTLSYRCNFVCEHCYSRDEVCEELPTSDLKRIVDVLAEKQVPFINFGGGEPLIREDLFELRITSYNVCYTKLLRSRGNGRGQRQPDDCQPAWPLPAKEPRNGYRQRPVGQQRASYNFV